MTARMERVTNTQPGAYNHGFVPDQLMGHAVCWTGLHSLGARGQYFTSAGCG